MANRPEALTATWHFPTHIMFGPGGVRRLAAACGGAGIARPLVVTDPTLARLDVVARAVEDLKSADLSAGLFAAVRPNPVGATVEAGLAAYRDGGHDGIVADRRRPMCALARTGKASRLHGRAGGPCAALDRDAIEDWALDSRLCRAAGFERTASPPVTVRVPNTARTGSEIGRARRHRR